MGKYIWRQSSSTWLILSTGKKSVSRESDPTVAGRLVKSIAEKLMMATRTGRSLQQAHHEI